VSEVDRSLVGTETAAFTVEVERGAIRRFAEAIEDGNPIFNDPAAAKQQHCADLVAPPTFATSFRLPMDPPWIANLDRRRIVAGETSFAIVRPITAGMVLTCRMKLRAVEDKDGRKGRMQLLHQDLTGKDANGDIVFVSSRATVYRPAEQSLA
jgi:acyl dehydratase